MNRNNIKANYGEGMTYDLDITSKKPRKGGKDSKMSNNTKAESPKRSKAQNTKSKGEHAKDIVIAILITAVVAFVGGMAFANKQSAEIKNAVSAAQQAATPKAEAIAPASK